MMPALKALNRWRFRYRNESSPAVNEIKKLQTLKIYFSTLKFANEEFFRFRMGSYGK